MPAREALGASSFSPVGPANLLGLQLGAQFQSPIQEPSAPVANHDIPLDPANPTDAELSRRDVMLIAAGGFATIGAAAARSRRCSTR